MSRQKKLRRTAKQVLKFGPTAKATHKLKGGRTGSVHSKKPKGKK